MNQLSYSLKRRLGLLAMLLVLVALLLAAAPATTYADSAESPTAQGVYHTVAPGEYLSLIAVRYGTTVQAILYANPNIYNPNIIYPGMVLYIPTGYPPAPVPPPPPAPQPPPQYCRYYHTVVYGQTMLQIGNIYGVSPFAIAEANNIYNLNYIYAGQTLCIP